MDKRALRIISYTLLILLILSVLPLLAMGIFSAPAADDYAYSSITRTAWRETGSLVELAAAVWAVIKRYYLYWQGTFSAALLMSLQPTVFSDQLYVLVPFLMITGLCLSTCYLFAVVFSKYFGADRNETLIVSLTAVFLSVQLVPFPVEAFYWYNGSLFYTGFHAIAMFMFALTLLSIKDGKRRKQIFCCAGAALLALLVGGGNLVTALVASVIIVTIVGLRILFRQSWAAASVVMLVLLAAFAISIIAPGNAIRQANLPITPPLEAILKSFPAVVTFTAKHVNPAVFPALAALIPLLYKMAGRSSFHFRFPAFVTALMYCVLASSFTPTIYAQSSLGPERKLNINFYMLIIFIIFTCFYWCGWFAKRVKLPDKTGAAMGRVISVAAALMFVIMFSVTGMRDIDSVAAFSAVRSLASGQARQYRLEYDERLKIYQDPAIRDMVVTPFTVKPHLLYFSDVEPDPENWKNQALCNFYGKNTIRLLE